MKKLDKEHFIDYANIKLEGLREALDYQNVFDIQMFLFGQISLWEKAIKHVVDFDTETELRNYIHSLDTIKDVFCDKQIDMFNKRYGFLLDFVKGQFEAICEVYKYLNLK